jgi:hypothetical protein
MAVFSFDSGGPVKQINLRRYMSSPYYKYNVPDERMNL